MNLMGEEEASHQQVWSHANGAAHALRRSHTCHAPRTPSERWEEKLGRKLKLTRVRKVLKFCEAEREKGVVHRFTCVLQLSDDGRKTIMPKMYLKCTKKLPTANSECVTFAVSFNSSALTLSEQPQICKTQFLLRQSMVMKTFVTSHNAFSWKGF